MQILLTVVLGAEDLVKNLQTKRLLPTNELLLHWLLLPSESSSSAGCCLAICYLLFAPQSHILPFAVILEIVCTTAASKVICCFFFFFTFWCFKRIFLRTQSRICSTSKRQKYILPWVGAYLAPLRPSFLFTLSSSFLHHCERKAELISHLHPL